MGAGDADGVGTARGRVERGRCGVGVGTARVGRPGVARVGVEGRRGLDLDRVGVAWARGIDIVRCCDRVGVELGVIATISIMLVPCSDDETADASLRAPILRALAELGHDDIAIRWLIRVSEQPPHDLGAIDALYQLALRKGDLAAAELAARRRLAESSTSASRIALARVLFRREQFAQVIRDLADVPRWRGRLDEQADAWLLACDAHLELRAWDAALECLHKLDGSGVIAPARRGEVTRRLAIVSEQRTAEAKRKAIEALERSIAAPPR